MSEMRRQIENLTKSTTITNYSPELVNAEIPYDELLEVMKSLPNFYPNKTNITIYVR